MPWRACKRRSLHEHRRPQARAGLTPQLSRSSETVSVRHARRSHRLGGAIAELTLDPWQRDVLLCRRRDLLLNATRQSGKSTVAALKAAWTVLQGGLAVVVSPSLRQSGFLFRKLTRHLVASEAASGARHSPRSSWSQVGWRCPYRAIVPPCCAACRYATRARQCCSLTKHRVSATSYGPAAGACRLRGAYSAPMTLPRIILGSLASVLAIVFLAYIGMLRL